jgi:hypothetical protein
VAWWTTWIVSPDRPGVCSVRYDAPVPAGTGLVVEDAEIRIALEIPQPLKEFRIGASAPAAVFDRPEAVYSGEAGTAAKLDLDLIWTTDGTPYHYDVTTRYEIPCTVHGTVRVDDTEWTIRGQGQRDHSWGVRDWWAFGWCWSSARLDDGTRVHLTQVRPPGFPIALGYVQTTTGEVHPISTLSVTEELGLHSLPVSARIELSAGSPPVDLAIAVAPLAFGPVLLRDDDGRTSRFPRAMVRYVTEDGRAGLGWIEWNQPEGS